MTTYKKPKRRTDIEVQARIEELVLMRRTPSQICQALESDPAIKPDRLPTLRTIERIVKDLAPDDGTGPWKLGDSGPEDTTIVLRTIAALALGSEKHSRIYEPLTRREAEWVVRVARAAPDLPPGWPVWRLARMYLGHEQRNMPTRPVDFYVAMAPWRGERERVTYLEAIAEAGIPKVPDMTQGNIFKVQARETTFKVQPEHEEAPNG